MSLDRGLIVEIARGPALDRFLDGVPRRLDGVLVGEVIFRPSDRGRLRSIFQKAIQRRNVVAAMAAARELPKLSLADALDGAEVAGWSRRRARGEVASRSLQKGH